MVALKLPTGKFTSFVKAAEWFEAKYEEINSKLSDSQKEKLKELVGNIAEKVLKK